MKGIVLAGGTGTRLHPITRGISKQLMPVYDKPMVYYPLSTLMMAGIREVLVITTPQDRDQFQRLLGDGGQWGMSLSYAAQARPEGLAQAFIIGADFIGDDSVALVLGDNIFFGRGLGTSTAPSNAGSTGGHIFAYRVAEPSAYGVVEFDDAGRCSPSRRSPPTPKSNYAVPGSTSTTTTSSTIARDLRPSARGELEITGGQRGVPAPRHADRQRAAARHRVVRHRAPSTGCSRPASTSTSSRRGRARRSAASRRSPGATAGSTTSCCAALLTTTLKSGYGGYLLEPARRRQGPGRWTSVP